MTIPAIRHHDDAVIAALEALDLTVGDGQAPDEQPPYVTVYRIPGGGTNGTLENPDRDAEIIYQVTCTGLSREQAAWLADKALGLLQTTLAVEDRFIPRVTLDILPGVMRDDQQTPPVFWCTPRFRVFSTPAPT